MTGTVLNTLHNFSNLILIETMWDGQIKVLHYEAGLESLITFQIPVEDTVQP